MTGADETYDELPYLWTDIADLARLEYIGLGFSWDEYVVSGEPESGRFSVYYGAAGRTAGVLRAGGDMDGAAAGRLIRGGSRLSCVAA